LTLAPLASHVQVAPVSCAVTATLILPAPPAKAGVGLGVNHGLPFTVFAVTVMVAVLGTSMHVQLKDAPLAD